MCHKNYSTSFHINGIIAFTEESPMSEEFFRECADLCKKYNVYSDITKIRTSGQEKPVEYNPDLDIDKLKLPALIRRGLSMSKIYNLEELNTQRYLQERLHEDLSVIGEKSAKELISICESYGIHLKSEKDLDYYKKYKLSRNDVYKIYKKGFDSTEQLRNTDSRTLSLLFDTRLYYKITKNIKITEDD